MYNKFFGFVVFRFLDIQLWASKEVLVVFQWPQILLSSGPEMCPTKHIHHIELEMKWYSSLLNPIEVQEASKIIMMFIFHESQISDGQPTPHQKSQLDLDNFCGKLKQYSKNLFYDSDCAANWCFFFIECRQWGKVCFFIGEFTDFWLEVASVMTEYFGRSSLLHFSRTIC